MQSWTQECPAEHHGDVKSSARTLLLTVEQAAAALAIGRTKTFELIRTGELESILIGASRRVPTQAVEAYVLRLRSHSLKVSRFLGHSGAHPDRSWLITPIALCSQRTQHGQHPDP